ncbi:ferric reductase family protein [Aspergillus clavatus NRRL 1]|uniref:ferric-chelate reductase (NADPH) n=1 Tax=Aspergillus clavatus (strain ATCC 1007 / CBS 513.65 / DSM 816 / NCTC 3887 / NRRL 1 / QM 1276 / 107) TaxID=344612 RepID=A1CMN3_ASPCL|nr:metalloreductase, putative [Aspergillus clavatus NRRL 1]EAW08820.1 metalloreductase, putative [Aspergillus clavatus NRRL 1]
MDMDGMDMSGMDHSHMSMGDGEPDLFYVQRMYWAVVGSAIAAGTVVNLLNRFLAYQRLRDSTLTPSKPKSLLFRSYATVTAIVREASYATLPPVTIRGRSFHFAPLGPVAIILANLVVVLVFCFYKLDTMDQWKWENVGYRTGFVTIAQLPLIFLLAGRQNLIGMFVGMSYERLNWFHRWISRTLWLTATIHMGFWFRSWGRYDYITYQLQNDVLTQRGFAAWCILTFIVISSAAPVRRLSYELFVLQHLVTFVGFIAAVWLHAPDEVKVWVWMPIGFLVFDRVARYAWATYANLSIFHPSKPKQHSLWANRATFTPLPGNVTRVTIENPGVGWKAGQHVFLTCHSVVPLQSHPFTIASIPEDNKMEFLVRAEKGGTRRFFRYASKHHHILGSGETSSAQRPRTVFIDGPYGTIRPLTQFDSVVLLAGGMGATFVIPLLRDIVAGWKTECLQSSGASGKATRSRLVATKRIRFVWVVKSRAQLSWFETQIQSVLSDVKECQRVQPDLIREIDVSIYITCDEKLEQLPQKTACLPPQSQPTESPKIIETRNDKSWEKDNVSIRSISGTSSSEQATGCLPGGGCCCTAAVEDEDEITEHKCTCSGHSAAARPSEPAAATPSAAADEKPKPESSSQSQPLNLLSGRPQPRTIIRKVLEKAEGESAVVVCGPEGLSDDVRRSVVYLSDERAVHKGTGAQGIYLHVETFGW